MIDRLIRASRDFSRFYVLPPHFSRFNAFLGRFSARAASANTSVLKLIACDTARGLKTTAHHGIMVVGVSAIGTLGVMFVRPDVMDKLKSLSPFHLVTAEGAESASDSTTHPVVSPGFDGQLIAASDFPPLTASDIIEARRLGISANALQNAARGSVGSTGDVGANTFNRSAHAIPLATQFVSFPVARAGNMLQPGNAYKQQALVTNWLAKKYRVASDATDMLVSAAYTTAKEIKLDPLLILSVIAIESGFNPFAESPVGAQGLMQVMSKVHHEKFQNLGGLKAALNPVANIKVGSLILKDYVTRGGSVEAGLKMYVGAAAFDNDFGYGWKVLAEYRRLQEVAVGKTVSMAAPVFTAKAKPAIKTAESPSSIPGKDENASTPANDNKPDLTATVAAI